MPRRLLDPGPFDFDQLSLRHATEADLDTARRVKKKFFPDAELIFAKYAVPTFELIESNLVDAISQGKFPVEAYEAWRLQGASESEAREAFARADAAQRRDPAFAGELAQIEALERLIREGAELDPLIARSLEMPLSTGEEALFIIDGRHRLIAAAATNISELLVYVGR